MFQNLLLVSKNYLTFHLTSSIKKYGTVIQDPLVQFFLSLLIKLVTSGNLFFKKILYLSLLGVYLGLLVKYVHNI